MGKKILIIDDEPDIRFLLKRALVASNYEVSEAESLKEGLEVFRQIGPDVIILDVNLPDGNGMHFACQFKKESNDIIFISADNDQLIEEYKKYCASGFLRKPFTAGELVSVISGVKQQTA